MNSKVVVKKFGGTSLGSLERIENVADRIIEDSKTGQIPVIVASAMSGETNRLVSLANRVSPEERGPAYDMLVASGEQVSVALLSMALSKRGAPSRPLLAHQLGIKTNALHAKARIKSIDTDSINELLAQNTIPVVAGFQGISDDENITTLGRGGSDTTAVAIAAALNLDTCEIYTDVAAVCTADPRLVPKAKEIQRLSLEEMMEMSSLGSKVLHTRCVELAAKHNINIHLRSTFEKREGTWILPEVKNMENPLVTSVTHDENTAIVKLYPVPMDVGFLANIFTELSEAGIVVDIISQSHMEKGQRVAFSVHNDDSTTAAKLIERLAPQDCQIQTVTDVAKISVVGMGMKTQPGVAAKFFQVLSDLEAPLHLVTTSEIKISGIIDNKYLKNVANKLHSTFNLDKIEG